MCAVVVGVQTKLFMKAGKIVCQCVILLHAYIYTSYKTTYYNSGQGSLNLLMKDLRLQGFDYSQITVRNKIYSGTF